MVFTLTGQLRIDWSYQYNYRKQCRVIASIQMVLYTALWIYFFCIDKPFYAILHFLTAVIGMWATRDPVTPNLVRVVSVYYFLNGLISFSGIIWTIVAYISWTTPSPPVLIAIGCVILGPSIAAIFWCRCYRNELLRHPPARGLCVQA